MNRTLRKLTALALGMALLLSACGGANIQPPPEQPQEMFVLKVL